MLLAAKTHRALLCHRTSRPNTYAYRRGSADGCVVSSFDSRNTHA